MRVPLAERLAADRRHEQHEIPTRDPVEAREQARSDVMLVPCRRNHFALVERHIQSNVSKFKLQTYAEQTDCRGVSVNESVTQVKHTKIHAPKARLVYECLRAGYRVVDTQGEQCWT